MNVAGIAALEGMQKAQASVAASAGRLTKAGTPPSASGAGGDVVDLSAEMVALMQAKSFHAAMVTVAQAADEVDSHLLNMLG